MNIYDNLKINLKNMRISLGLTQERLSELTKIPRANLGRYETGENTPPLDILCVLADFFDISVDELLGRDK